MVQFEYSLRQMSEVQISIRSSYWSKIILCQTGSKYHFFFETFNLPTFRGRNEFQKNKWTPHNQTEFDVEPEKITVLRPR